MLLHRTHAPRTESRGPQTTHEHLNPGAARRDERRGPLAPTRARVVTDSLLARNPRGKGGRVLPFRKCQRATENTFRVAPPGQGFSVCEDRICSAQRICAPSVLVVVGWAIRVRPQPCARLPSSAIVGDAARCRRSLLWSYSSVVRRREWPRLPLVRGAGCTKRVTGASPTTWGARPGCSSVYPLPGCAEWCCCRRIWFTRFASRKRVFSTIRARFVAIPREW